MASVYTINGQPATKEQYDAFIASNPTLASPSDLASAAKIANPPILGEPSIPPMSGFQGGPSNTRSMGQSNKGPLPPNWQKTILGPNRDLGGVLPGAQPRLTVPVMETNFTTMDGQSTSSNPDLRVKIRVPNDYLTQFTSGSSFGELAALSGIIFPYTPTITFEHKADYTSQTPVHSNYAINFYKNSSVGDISISGKFTVQNESDALVYISTIHLLKALTKMRFGTDLDAGAPPPVCRLDAYGEFMLNNVPVVITSFKADLLDSIDFYTVSSRASGVYGQTSVPTVSSIQITCKPMYSRAEMQSISVSGYLNDISYRSKGFL